MEQKADERQRGSRGAREMLLGKWAAGVWRRKAAEEEEEDGGLKEQVCVVCPQEVGRGVSLQSPDALAAGVALDSLPSVFTPRLFWALITIPRCLRGK